MFDPPYAPDTWLPYLELLLEGLRAVAWPIVVYLVARIFRGEIKKLFGRMTRVGLTGAEFAAASQISRPMIPSKTDDLKKFPGIAPTPAIEKVRLQIHSQLENIKEDDREELLVANLAQEQLDKGFALFYNSIFGSQIRLLLTLDTKNGHCDMGWVQNYFSKIQLEHDFHSDKTLSGYLAYLLQGRAITQDDTGIALTDIGRDFLAFLSRFSLIEDRPL